MKKFSLGLIVGSVGITLLETSQEVIATFGELVKAKLGTKIVALNNEIEKSTNHSDEPMRTIGFATTIEENEDEEHVED